MGIFEELGELDEKGFVFLDDNSRPYLCRIWGDNGDAWLFYWHPDNHWVSLRRVTQMDVWTFPRNLSEKQQQMYHDAQERYNQGRSAGFTSENEPAHKGD